MSPPASPIDFWFDLSSPYSYIAAQWIDRLAEAHGRRVRWHAMLLGVTFQAAQLRSPVSHPLKREYALRDFARSARFEGVPYRQPEPFPIPTQNAARVFWWLHDGPGPEAAVGWARACFRAFFTDNVPLNDPAALRTLAAAHGLPADEAERAWNDPHWKQRLKEVNEAAVAAGVFGAPFFVVDGEPFWGHDRRAQMERWLAQGPF